MHKFQTGLFFITLCLFIISVVLFIKVNNDKKSIESNKNESAEYKNSETVDTEVINTEVVSTEVINTETVSTETEFIEEPSTESIGEIEVNPDLSMLRENILYKKKLKITSLVEGTTYTMDLKEGKHGNKATYCLINDSNSDVIVYYTEDDREFSSLLLKYNFPKGDSQAYNAGTSTYADSITFRFESISKENLLNHLDANKTVKLNSIAVGDKINAETVRYLYNNTNSVVELEANTGVGYAIPAGRVAYFTPQGYSYIKRLR